MVTEQTERLNLIQQIKSGNHDLRDKAIERLRETGWLYDSSLKEIDLSHADLRGANLSEARLEWANLNHANLQHADLTRTWLYHASLKQVNLNEASMRAVRLGFADLRGASLIQSDAGKAEFTGSDMSDANCYAAAFWETNLSETNLSNADLRMANLRGAKLVYTQLHNSQVEGASIGSTVFGSIDFRTVIGLDEVEHWRPCHIDIDSLYRSKGIIPKIFLQRCGVPETMITYIKSIVSASKPIEFYKVFLSFSSADADFADRLYQALNHRGISCWKYDREQHLGHDVYDNIDAGLKLSDKVVLVSSKAAWESPYVIEEIKYAVDRQLKSREAILIPIAIDNTLSDASDFLMNIVARKIYASFQDWEQDASIFEKGVTQLIAALSKSSV